jgi:hypothetical protein
VSDIREFSHVVDEARGEQTVGLFGENSMARRTASAVGNGFALESVDWFLTNLYAGHAEGS